MEEPTETEPAGEKVEPNLKAAGGEILPAGRSGLRLRGWVVESRHRPIINSLARQQWEEKLGTSHLPEMVFGDSSLTLLHEETAVKISFNAFDALSEWKHEGLPPVEVPAAAKWKFRSKPSQQVILDYDYTFTTPYCGGEAIDRDPEKLEASDKNLSLCWEDSREEIDLVALASKEPILFYDEVVLYEDELADSGVSLLTVKVRVMPNYWFLLLRFWLRVDGVLMRLRDTRLYCSFGSDPHAIPIILRESCWREVTFQDLSAQGFSSDSASYSDPNLIMQTIPVIMKKTQKLRFPG
ncbi:TIP41-like protein [Aristolochia californica]|uniref:TIP41-like protein n=1 Tax=Aristolochia californica TaxID=171875 RepID=UPI0035E39976